MPSRHEMLDELRRKFSDQIIEGNEGDASQVFDPLTFHTPEGDTCLHIAAIRDDSKSIKRLLGLGLDVDVQGDMGNTALHYANRPGRERATKL